MRLADLGVPPASLALICTHRGGWRLLPPFSSFPLLLSVASSLTVSQRIARILPLHYDARFLEVGHLGNRAKS